MYVCGVVHVCKNRYEVQHNHHTHKSTTYTYLPLHHHGLWYRIAAPYHDPANTYVCMSRLQRGTMIRYCSPLVGMVSHLQVLYFPLLLGAEIIGNRNRREDDMLVCTRLDLASMYVCKYVCMLPLFRAVFAVSINKSERPLRYRWQQPYKPHTYIHT